ncbi:orotidine-5'-phosphate decarboxylase [Parashewanella spongiae]|uniref:Orotidine 5'-phosphate decarboxylase n=1 Tax=Parashewanella spongiae TaxID=342950 RepID=A0A3A6U230_9GAMM|nr:orotidine-5'-phosphate decarboxylase [Parashewanella spongiae]MCL1077727.1 orotidine-5'-phosphate decarboxylase [Parashewanella spongiae]RJY18071.1 orotidine-5'-phosphate decarboxylase [Parashewanella spongiae]
MLEKPILVALDFDKKEKALELVSKLDPSKCRLKIGKEMFTLFGPQFVIEVQNKGFDVFLDLKFHDIPNTVAKAVAAAAELGVWMVNVHASGGKAMMEAAKSALLPYGKDAPLLIAVTVLTSMKDSELPLIGIKQTANEQVQLLAKLAHESGMDGIVCSAQEATVLKSNFGVSFKLITPGIRPVGADVGDQQRVMTPEKAIAAGSDYLVIGRPITQADDPLKSLESIYNSIG